MSDVDIHWYVAGLGRSGRDIVSWWIKFLEGFSRVWHSCIVSGWHLRFDLCPSQDFFFGSSFPLVKSGRDVVIFMHDVESEPVTLKS